MCGKHYQAEHRNRVREGTWTPVERKPGGTLTVRKDGYVLRRAPDHPLIVGTCYILEHRYQAYEKYGPGDQTCHWCNRELNWQGLHVDHLDWDRGNNDPANLVTSCPTCNCKRLSPKEREEAERTVPLTASASKLMGLALRNRD